MRHQGPGDSAIHPTQLSVSAALINRGTPVDEVVEILLAATRAAAGDAGRGWSWEREERELRRMCRTWIEKHPEDADEPASEGTALPNDELPLRPYVPRPFTEIPRRRWLHAGHYIRKSVVETIAPGGYGKTSLLLCNAIEMALDRGLIGPPPTEDDLRVLYWNAEDSDEEVERRIAAICVRHQVDPNELAGRLFLGSRIVEARRVARVDRRGNVVLNRAMLDKIAKFIVDNRVDGAIFDPLVRFHRVPESDNGAMAQVVEAFEQIADATNTCIELSHHTRKPAPGSRGELTADDSRGASAAPDAARSVRVLNRMTKEEAEPLGIEPDDRRQYLRVARDKTNMIRADKARWIHLADVPVPNGDSVQAAEAWGYPEQPDGGASPEDAEWAQAEVGRSPTGSTRARRAGSDTPWPRA